PSARIETIPFRARGCSSGDFLMAIETTIAPHSTPLDVAAIKADFPILNQPVAPGRKPLVFLDSAASSQKPRSVIDALSRYYETTHSNIRRGVYDLSERATGEYEAARRKVARFISAASHREIVFTRNTTEAINLVANAWGRANIG